MRNKGFTVIEVAIAIVIVTALVIVITNFTRNVLALNQSASGSLSAELEGRRTMKFVTSELRSAATAVTGAYAVESAATDTIIFFADITNDGNTERIRYFTDPATKTLKRGVTSPGGNPLSYNLALENVTTLANDLLSTTTPVFEYFDSNYAGTSTPLSLPVDVSRIRLVRITVFIDRDASRSPLPMKLTSEVNLRNLKDNL